MFELMHVANAVVTETLGAHDEEEGQLMLGKE